MLPVNAKLTLIFGKTPHLNMILTQCKRKELKVNLIQKENIYIDKSTITKILQLKYASMWLQMLSSRAVTKQSIKFLRVRPFYAPQSMFTSQVPRPTCLHKQVGRRTWLDLYRHLKACLVSILKGWQNFSLNPLWISSPPGSQSQLEE